MISGLLIFFGFARAALAQTVVLPGNASWLGDYGSGDGTPDYRDYLPIHYILWGPNADAVLRVIVGPDAGCPLFVADGSVAAPEMNVRASGDNRLPHAFPITVCDAILSSDDEKDAWNAGSLRLDGINSTIKINFDPKRVVEIGDTGLRVKPDNLGLGTCSDGPSLYGVYQCPINFTQADLNASEVAGQFQSLDNWPLQSINDYAAAQNPDMVVHVGDYLYRQGPCPKSSGEDCVGINGPPFFTDEDLNGTVANFLPGYWGDTWIGWWSDFVFPSLNLLKSSPWIVARGNHENCDRGGYGFFVLLDPRQYEGDRAGDYCENYTLPYRVPFVHEQYLVIDNNLVGEYYTQNETNVVCPSAPPEGQDVLVPVVQNRYNDPTAVRLDIDSQRAVFAAYWLQVHEWSKEYDTNFVVVHRPVLAVFCNSDSQFLMTCVDWNMQVTLEPDTLDHVSAVISGHLHIAQGLEFVNNSLPVQIVVGHGGTALDSNALDPSIWPFVEVELRSDGDYKGRVERGFVNVEMYGFAVMERDDQGDYTVDFLSYNQTTNELVAIEFPVFIEKGPRVASVAADSDDSPPVGSPSPDTSASWLVGYDTWLTSALLLATTMMMMLVR